MRENELISIIITTYKRSLEIIYRAIESVLVQTYKNIEIILIDDNDADSIFRNEIKEELLKKYNNIVYIEHDKNLGAQKSRNDGIRRAKGKYIAFLDDDDEWIDTKLEKQIEAFNENIGLIYCKGYVINDINNKCEKYFNYKYIKKELTFEDLLEKNYIGSTSQVIIPKFVFDKIGLFDENLTARQDYEMWIRISKHYKIVAIDEYLFKYYIHDGEQITKDAKKSLESYEIIYNKYKIYYDDNKKAKSGIYANIGYQYYLNKDYKNFIKYLKACFLLNKIRGLKLIRMTLINKRFS